MFLSIFAFVAGNAVAQPWALGNQLNTHANWDTGGSWKTGNSKQYNEGDVVPHVVKFTPDSVASFFLDICLEGLTGGIYGYVAPLAPYNADYSPTSDLDGGAIGALNCYAGNVVCAKRATITNVTGPLLEGYNCDGTGEIAWEVTFTSADPDSIDFLYFGGTVGKPGDTGVDGGTLDETTSPSNKQGVWQSRAESGGDKTTQITTPGPALPVELVSFDATLNGSDVVLTWETASETNNQGFAIEHSDNGAPFTEIAFVNGAGTTLNRQTYGYTVNEISAGLHRFRLKQIDFDGAFTYSAMVEVTSEVPGTHLLSEAYPNPFNPSTSFSLAVSRDQEVAINVYDMLGRHVSSLFRGALEANVARTFSVNAANWTSGTYTIVVEGEAFRDSRSLVLLK